MKSGNGIFAATWLLAFFLAWLTPLAAQTAQDSLQANRENEFLEPPKVEPTDDTAQPEVEATRPTTPTSRVKSSDLLLPVFNIVPGLGVALQGRPLVGLTYFGAAFGGGVLLVDGMEGLLDENPEFEGKLFGAGAPSLHNPNLQKVIAGGSIIQGTMFLSAYDVFHASLPGFKAKGKYGYVKRQEDVGQLMVAPFQFNYLKRKTTWIPLASLAATAAVMVPYARAHPEEPGTWTPYRWHDPLFTGTISYSAGVTEEALFRGWLYPVAYEYTGENIWVAQIAQAGLFAAAHMSEVRYPIAQAALGLYFGWLTERQQWSIGESAFIHFWWDVIVFTAALFSERQVDAKVGVTLPLGF